MDNDLFVGLSLLILIYLLLSMYWIILLMKTFRSFALFLPTSITSSWLTSAPVLYSTMHLRMQFCIMLFDAVQQSQYVELVSPSKCHATQG